MKQQGRKLLFSVAVAAIPALLFAFSSGPPIRRTGAEVDGGLNCTACHRTFAPANSDPRGRITIQAAAYKPGVRQTVRVTVEHPEAVRWGFELTVRQARDEAQKAGTLSPGSGVQVRCDDGSVRGVPGPCDDQQLEFAMHTSEGTLVGVNGSRTFEVEWTPPSDDVGDVIFYAAGNAADNSGNNSGDRIYATSVRIASDACTLSRRPILRSVVNAATFQPGGAMNTMVSLIGADFLETGRTRQASRGDFVAGAFPRELACVAVEIGGRRAPITYVQQDQINAQTPTLTPAGPVQVRVIANPGRPNEMASDPVNVTFTNHSPAFFLFPGNTIAALFPNSTVPVADPTAVPGGRPARPGDIVTLYGTGFGPTEPVYQAGEIAQAPAPLRDPFTVTIGGITLAREDILYAGLVPQSVSGLYQFNVRIPATVGDGTVPVMLAVGGMQTQSGAGIPVKREVQ